MRGRTAADSGFYADNPLVMSVINLDAITSQPYSITVATRGPFYVTS